MVREEVMRFVLVTRVPDSTWFMLIPELSTLTVVARPIRSARTFITISFVVTGSTVLTGFRKTIIDVIHWYTRVPASICN